MADGAPTLPGGAQPAQSPPLVTQDTAQPGGNAALPKWGIFQDGKLAIEPDSVIEVDSRRDFKIEDYPIEMGSFESYNKVAIPNVIRISLAKGGSKADRETFMGKALKISKSLDLYTVVIPEGGYPDVNCFHTGVRRTSTNGVTMVTVEFYFQKIIQKVATSTTAASSPSGNDPKQNGPVAPTPPSGGQPPPAKDWSPLPRT